MKRFCYVILATQADENGYIPSIVYEGEKGHSPLVGQGVGASPWYWGKTYAAACNVCDAENEKLGLTKEEAAKIVFSSM